MIAKLKIHHDGEIEDRKTSYWLCTFNDLMTQLMVFFVLIFSLSTLTPDAIHSVRIQLQSGLGVFNAGKKTSIGIVPPLNTYDIGTKTFNEQIEKSVDKFEALEGFDVRFSEKGIVLSLEDSVLFESGSADISRAGAVVLEEVSKSILSRVSNDIMVIGYTDSKLIHTKRFPSNWELSTARAVNVVKHFIAKGYILPKRLSAVGYGATRPLVPNDSAENCAKNRRVEFVIITDENT